MWTFTPSREDLRASGVPYPCHNRAELWQTEQTQTDEKDHLTCTYADRRWSARSSGPTSQVENAGSIPVARSCKVADQTTYLPIG